MSGNACRGARNAMSAFSGKGLGVEPMGNVRVGMLIIVLASLPMMVDTLLVFVCNGDLEGVVASPCCIFGHGIERGLINFGFVWSIIMMLIVPVGALLLVIGVSQNIYEKLSAAVKTHHNRLQRLPVSPTFML
jgi:hypothetical protein